MTAQSPVWGGLTSGPQPDGARRAGALRGADDQALSVFVNRGDRVDAGEANREGRRRRRQGRATRRAARRERERVALGRRRGAEAVPGRLVGRQTVGRLGRHGAVELGPGAVIRRADVARREPGRGDGDDQKVVCVRIRRPLDDDPGLEQGLKRDRLRRPGARGVARGARRRVRTGIVLWRRVDVVDAARRGKPVPRHRDRRVERGRPRAEEADELVACDRRRDRSRLQSRAGAAGQHRRDVEGRRRIDARVVDGRGAGPDTQGPPLAVRLRVEREDVRAHLAGRRIEGRLGHRPGAHRVDVEAWGGKRHARPG